MSILDNEGHDPQGLGNSVTARAMQRVREEWEAPLRAEIERLRQRVEALEHLIVEECDPTSMSDIPNAMLAQTARDAVARRATEAFSDEQSVQKETGQ